MFSADDSDGRPLSSTKSTSCVLTVAENGSDGADYLAMLFGTALAWRHRLLLGFEAMGLFDDLKKQAPPAEMSVNSVDVALQGIAVAERQLEAVASRPSPGFQKTPPGVELLRLARDNPTLDEERKYVFLEALVALPNEHAAALKAGVTVVEARRARREDPQFAVAWDHAVALATGAAEGEAWRRAVQGVPKQVWYQGMPVGVQQEYSDALMVKILAANDPKYEPRSNVKAEVNANVNWFDLVNAMHDARGTGE